jgi:hypothetical protein
VWEEFFVYSKIVPWPSLEDNPEFFAGRNHSRDT